VHEFLREQGVARPDISTQVRYCRAQELRRGEVAPRAMAAPAAGSPSPPDLRTGDLQDTGEGARQMLGKSWLEDYVAAANADGIERVLVQRGAFP
jgi:hypothetical protein